VVLGDISDPAVQAEVLAACPEPDILVNNNAGPKLRDFRELDRQAILDGVTQNMVDADRTDPEGDRRHGRTRFRPHRQHHLAVGLPADPRPRPVVRRPRRPDLVSLPASPARSSTRT
jgi:hypothetical protein